MKRKHRDAMIAMGIKIAALERLLKNHGQAHMAQDLLPQFRELVKQVDMHLSRLAAHDESIEALSETVDQLSTCKCEAGAGMLKRIATIETIQNRDGATLNQHFERISNQNTKIAGLEIRLSRAQDMIAECHPSGCIEIKKPKKTCATCKNALLDGSSCTLFNTRCLNHRLWCERKPTTSRKKAQ